MYMTANHPLVYAAIKPSITPSTGASANTIRFILFSVIRSQYAPIILRGNFHGISSPNLRLCCATHLPVEHIFSGVRRRAQTR
jgi:hypothetical protein